MLNWNNASSPTKHMAVMANGAIGETKIGESPRDYM
jgi:hypothetical protein